MNSCLDWVFFALRHVNFFWYYIGFVGYLVFHDFKKIQSDTVLCISVDPRPHGLETRVIIKISTHPCYPRTFDYFIMGQLTIINIFGKIEQD